MRIVSFAFVLALTVSPALAQQREPAQRQVLLDLAYVLGEAHALRQVCAGPSDQFWRTRMMRMLEAESGDALFEGRLRDTFNAGYVGRQAQFTQCSAQSRDAEAKVAARGQSLAGRLTAPAPRADSLAPR